MFCGTRVTYMQSRVVLHLEDENRILETFKQKSTYLLSLQTQEIIWKMLEEHKKNDYNSPQKASDLQALLLY